MSLKRKTSSSAQGGVTRRPGGKEEDVTVTVPYGSFASCLKIKEWTPLVEPDFLQYKYYSLGVGLVLEENAETGECVELIDTMTDNEG